MPNCICPTCVKAGYNTHGFDYHQSAKCNPVIRADQLEKDKVSERAEEIADARRPDIFKHVHVSIGKLLNNKY